MKTKFRLFSAFAAFACVLASGFAWGETTPVIRNTSCHPEKPYSVTEYGNEFECVKNAVKDAGTNDVLDLLLPVKVTDGQQIVIDRPIELKIKIEDVDKCDLCFKVDKGGVLTVKNYSSFCGRFIVDGGELTLSGGTFYTDGTYPVISTVNEENTVRVKGAAIKGKHTTLTSQTATAVRLDGDGTFTMSEGASIVPYVVPYSPYYTNSFNKAITVSRGKVAIENSTIVVNDYGLAIGADSEYVGEGDFSLSNNVQITSMRNCGIYAYATTNNVINLAVSDATVSSLDGGIKLDCPSDDETEDSDRHKLFLDGSTTIRTFNAFGDYAIADCSEGRRWQVTIKRGTYYRMRKYIVDDGKKVEISTNNWINSGSRVAWNPIDAEDNLTMTVMCEELLQIGVTFYGCGYSIGDVQVGAAGSVVTNYWIPFGGSMSVVDIAPETLGMTNLTGGVFDGWYETPEDAQTRTREVKSLSTDGKKLYAGWKPCVVAFWSPGNPDLKLCETGLARRVIGDMVAIDDLRPEAFGFPKSGYSFAGWYLDRECTGSAVTSLTVPVVTNLYANWIDKQWAAFIDGTTNKYKTVSEAIAAVRADQVVVLYRDASDEGQIVIDKSVAIALEGHSLGDPAKASGTIFEVSGTNSYLQVFPEGGTVYGTIAIDDDGCVFLDEGTYACKEGSVVSAKGTNYCFVASSVNFKGAIGEDGVVVDFAGRGGYAILSNSTVSCISDSALSDIAVSVENSEMSLVGTVVKAGSYGVMVTNGVLAVTKGSSITAPRGIAANPSSISVSDSSIISRAATNSVEEAYAFYLMPGAGDQCKLSLSGENQIFGGIYDENKKHPFLIGGSFYYEGTWTNVLEGAISGGTYSHQMSNEVVMAWIATNCVCVWESETRFTVTDPNANYTIDYDLWTNLPKEAQNAVNEGEAILTNSNPEVYGASTKYLKFNDARCTGEDGYKCEFMGWYLSDVTNSDQVVAISNGCVVVKVNGKSKLTDITGSLSLVAKWGDWKILPYSVSFASGVVIKDVDEDDPEFVTYHEVDLMDEDDMKANGVTISEDFPIDGLEYHEGDKSITLPSGITWEGHTLSGWAVYDPDDLTDPENPPETTNFFNVGEVELSKFVDSEGNPLDGVVLHAVWDQGGKHEGLDDFDHLYNDDPLAPVMSGGDTYTGCIMGDDGVMGTITVKCGVPNGRGEVSITATVKTAEDGTVTFRGKGVYEGGTIRIIDDLVNGEHSISSLTLDSKSICDGQYDGYDIKGGVNKFKGSQEDKDEGDLRLKHWLGKWMIIFATEGADSVLTYEKKVHGELEVIDTGKEDGDAHAYGYSYVVLDIKDKGLVSVSGKLANGKEVSSTATAIVGDTGVCVPVVCSIYSGYDWFSLYNFARNYGMGAFLPTVADNFKTTTNRGGFGFTAWFSNSETNLLELASENDSLIVNNVSQWDSSYDKSMPFTATVVATNAQKVADIKLSEKMVFYVDRDTNFGWYSNANDENIGDLDAGKYYIPSRTSEVPNEGYLQTVTASAPTNGAYSIKADGKAPKMKFVDADGMSYIVPGKNGSNYSALKLKYDQKKGVFTGSFKIYSLKTNWETDKTSLKKTKVTVSGGVANGRGYGFSHSKAVGSQPVMLVPVGDAMLSVPGGDEGGTDDGNEDDTEGDIEGGEEQNLAEISDGDE